MHSISKKINLKFYSYLILEPNWISTGLNSELLQIFFSRFKTYNAQPRKKKQKIHESNIKSNNNTIRIRHILFSLFFTYQKNANSRKLDKEI